MFRPITVADEVGSVLDVLERTHDDSVASTRTVAERPATLDGQVLAVLDNKTNTPLRERLVARLQEMFALEDVIVVLKDTMNVPPRPEDWDEVVKRGTVGLALYGA